MGDINVSGGKNVFHITPPTQRELGLETISENLTIKVRPKEKQYLEKLAKRRGLSISPMLRKIIFDHLKIEPKLHEVHNLLEEIL